MNDSLALIICTYMRPGPLLKLLQSIKEQDIIPDEILVIDGSKDAKTEIALKEHAFNNLRYYKVEDENRGLTRQRNYGISRVSVSIDIICFLDDDIVLKKDYFKILLSTYKKFPEALGVGGYIVNEVEWEKSNGKKSKDKFYFDGWMRNEPARFKLRRKLHLGPDSPPGFLPTFAHGRSVGFLPPSGKIYEVEQLMGGVSSFRTKVFDEFSFSTYFEGYGLYEDADFTIRVAKKGKLYVNTGAQLFHYHEASGRPNTFKYGKMVVRNGWYVWRVKYPKPKLKARIKWHATVLVLTLVRISNIFGKRKNNGALLEGLGRIWGWCSLIFNKPKLY